MTTLENKKILFLSPKFFGYEKEIVLEMERQGARVIFYDERPKNDFITKVLIRLNLKKLIHRRIDRYYKNIINETINENIDYLFLVSPETINKEKVALIKNYHKNLKIYIYLWDSIENKKNALSLLSIADKFITFDRLDKNKFKQVKFLPLFYINDYKELADRNHLEKFEYDLSFIGTVHSDRYQIIKDLELSVKNQNLKMFYYFYSPSKILFFFQRLLKKDFRTIQKKDISFMPLNKKDVLELFHKSKAIIDIHHPKQLGLTMRTIEVLGSKKKLLTTNYDIKNYNFYNQNNIYCFDRNQPEIDGDFFSAQYEELDSKIYESYSLSNWVKQIFKVTE